MKDKNLAKKVKGLRKRKGFSQEGLAEISGVSVRTIQRLENGETEPTGETLKRLSNAMGVNPEELMDWTLIEDKGFLKAMNLSALTFLVFPIIGILVPLIMWISKKDRLKDINEIGKSNLNFQITWTLMLFLGYIVNAIILGKEFYSTDVVLVDAVISSQRRLIVFFFVMYALNIALIVINTFNIQNDKKVFYQPTVTFIRN
ncbi:helix-turn-helix domain-containing protein [Cyclobacterium jeungdonense]|uniref:Helix-turn-helix domain-containing protein n=1 Tax=Cyclobacterium jeungdonense TaxID=708087 RepID=A0ABT8CBB3_9BACT|nr:helix-turn-helix domain-containing protein [Cyclobacterium jeungdonense]MDN3689437.1 helix-turn-helix domain-containing protein [Cyclobacterium jeungdonense]